MNFEQELIAARPQLCSFAYKLTKDKFQRDDLVQSTLERALVKKHLYKQEYRFVTWLMTIMSNVNYDIYRKNNRIANVEIYDQNSYFDYAVNTDYSYIDINKLLAKLSDKYRRIITLVYIDGYSFAEAAEIAQIPVGTVSCHLNRAKAKLREYVQ